MKQFIMFAALAAILLSWTAAAQPRKTPEDPSFEMKEFSFTNHAGKRLYGELYTPVSGPARKPVVLMAHGFNSTHGAFYDIIPELAKDGFICYTFDFMGGSTRSRSEGKTEEMTIFTERQDLLDAVELFRGMQGVDPDNLFLLGESQGGLVAAITAARIPDQVKGLALMYPAFSIPSSADRFYPDRKVPETLTTMGMTLGGNYYRVLFDYDLYADIARYKGPVIDIHGDADRVVNNSVSERAMQTYANCELHVIKGGDHGFSNPENRAECRALLREFFNKHVKAVDAFAEPVVYRIYDGAAPGSEKADYPEIVRPNGNDIRVMNVSVPTITVYKPENGIDTGAAVIIAPGGANMYLSWLSEGVNVARWLQQHGVTGIVLKYRTIFMGNTEQEVNEALAAFNNRRRSGPAPAGNTAGQAPRPSGNIPASAPQKTIQGDDGRQAVKYVRQHAAELGIKPDKIGLIGFSAGSALTVNVMNFHDADSRPDMAGLFYGYGSLVMPDNPMPVFICGPQFDLFPPDGAVDIYKKYHEKHLPAELHFITASSHGGGLKHNGQHWDEWIDMFYNFLKATKFVE